MGQVLVRIFRNLKTQVEFLSKNPTIMGLSDGDAKTNAWIGNLVNRFRTNVIIYHPVYKADVQIQSTSTQFTVHYVSRNERFVLLLREMLTRIEATSKVRTVVQNILGGTHVVLHRNMSYRGIIQVQCLSNIFYCVFLTKY